MPFKKSTVLPQRVHYWRGKHWPAIQRLVSRPGEGLKKVQRINSVIRVFLGRKSNSKLSPKYISDSARAIETVASEITDEVIRRAEEIGYAHKTWNEEYVNCLRHFWKKIPLELKKEIIRQAAQD